MALDLRQKKNSAQYLENKLTDFHQILYMHSFWQDLAWDCNTLFFAHLYQSNGPWFTPKFCFRSISWEQMDRISPNFIYAFILTRSTLGLLHIIFRTFVSELWPLIYAIISFPYNIYRTNGQNFTKFCICIHIDKIYVGIVTHHFSHICTSVMPLIYAKISFPFNMLRTNGQNFTKFYICIHIDKIYVGIVTHHFSHICTRVMAVDLSLNLVSVQYLENKWTEFHQTLYNY